jgi:hypothetical protein
MRSRLVSLTLLAFLVGMGWAAAQQRPSESGRGLSVEEIIKLYQSGFADDLIITKIRKNGKPFDLSTEELLELKKVGISEQVVKYLLDPSLPYAGPPPPALPSPAAPEPDKTSGPGKIYPPDALASTIPLDPGLYLIRDGSPTKIDLKLLLGANEGAGLGKVLMKKGKSTAFLPGPAAKTRIVWPNPIFYVRLPEGKASEDLLLVALEKKNDRREVETGAPGPKPEFKAEVIRPIDPFEVGPHLYRIAPADLKPGEYTLVLVGTAEPQKGTQGKAYDFAIEPPRPEKPGRSR